MNYEFVNNNRHSIQISGPNKEIIRMGPGHKKILSEYYLKYSPKYIKPIRQVEQIHKQVAKNRKQKTHIARTTSVNQISELTNKEIGVGILSCNRLHCVKRLLNSIKNFSPNDLHVVVSDESTDNKTKEFLRSLDWIELIDNKERRGVVYNTNILMHALNKYEYKIIFNDDVEVLKNGWHRFYFDSMIKSGFHHFCYREHSIYGAKESDESESIFGGIKIRTIKTKPQGAVMAFDDLSFKSVGYYDHKFPKYGMAHVDWSTRVYKSGIQPDGYHDVKGSNEYFKIYPEKTVEENKGSMLKKAKKIFDGLSKENRTYIPPIENYASKIHIIINTYNRPKMLNMLLSDIERYKASHDIIVYIYDDASKSDYSKVIDRYSKGLNINYRKFSINNGKKEYWKIVDIGFKDTIDSDADYFVKLDDDVRLVDGFFDKCIKYWNNIPDPNKICLNPLLDELRKGKIVWTGKNPKQIKYGNYEYWNSGWVDMMFFCERKFFKCLDYKINAVPKSRWIRNPERSSGVGAQISERLTHASKSMYQPGITLVNHEDHKSQMNEDIRKSQPILCKNKIIVSIASINRRHESLKLSIDSIIDQCDELCVYLNDYKKIPDYLNNNKIKIYDGTKLGDIGDIGKFYGLQRDGYIFTIDDDLIYPNNYIEYMINKIDQYDRNYCVGVHGAIFNFPISDYYKSRKCFHYKNNLTKDVGVHVIGTGTLAFHSSTIKPCREHFNHPNMADVWFAILAQKRKVGLKCVARQKDWLKDVPNANHNASIHGTKETLNKQTSVVKSFDKWKIY